MSDASKCGRCGFGKVDDKPHFSAPGGSACVELSFADHRATLVQLLCEGCTGELAQFMRMAWCARCDAWVRTTHRHPTDDVGSTEKSVGRGGGGTPDTGGAIGRGGGGGSGGVGSR